MPIACAVCRDSLNADEKELADDEQELYTFVSLLERRENRSSRPLLTIPDSLCFVVV